MPNSRAFSASSSTCWRSPNFDAAAAVGGLDVVVDDGEGLVRRAHLAPRHPQAFESLRARHLVDEMPVDVDGGARSPCVSKTCSSQILSYTVRGVGIAGLRTLGANSGVCPLSMPDGAVRKGNRH